MSRWMLLVTACRAPGPPGAIEVTGYLDGSRVRFVSTPGAVSALGSEAATEAGAAVVLENDARSRREGATADPAGSFVVTVAALPEDVVRLYVLGAASTDEVDQVVLPQLPFPAWTHADATLDPDHPTDAIVSVSLDPPRADGVVWAADVDLGATVLLDVHNDGALHQGVLPGAASGDGVLLTFVTGEDASEGLGIVVGP